MKIYTRSGRRATVDWVDLEILLDEILTSDKYPTQKQQLLEAFQEKFTAADVARPEGIAAYIHNLTDLSAIVAETARRHGVDWLNRWLNAEGYQLMEVRR